MKINVPYYIIVDFIITVVIPLVLGILFSLQNAILESVCCFCFSIISLIVIIIFRKKIFSKLVIDDSGLHLCYKKIVLKEILWQEIKTIRVNSSANFGGQLVFSKNIIQSEKEMLLDKKSIAVNLSSKEMIDLYKYKNKFPVEITNIDKLPDIIYQKFS